MAPDRREFIRGVGATLAAMIAGGSASCVAPASPTPTCYAPTVPPTTIATCYAPPTAAPVPNPTDEQWQALRSCWMDLAATARSAPTKGDSYQDLVMRHQAALDALSLTGKLLPDVADQISAAFDGAVTYLTSGSSEITPTPVLFDPQRDLAAQAVALAEMAELSEIDPDTVARAREALERDMASLAWFQTTPSTDATAGEKSVEPTPSYAEAEAARILVALLMPGES